MDAQPNILVAVDGSIPSEWALTAAAALARPLGARFTLLHVIPPPSTTFVEGVMLLVDDPSEELKAAGTALLQAAARRLPKGLVTTSVLRQGPAAQEIVAHARECGADYIVMGSRGRGRWFHFVLGSTAQAVLRDAPCPVLTVSHDPTHRPAFRPGVHQSHAPSVK
jgi:nucleotide-binding universal stress UspA family protein